MSPEERIKEAIEALEDYTTNNDGSYSDLFSEISKSLIIALQELEED